MHNVKWQKTYYVSDWKWKMYIKIKNYEITYDIVNIYIMEITAPAYDLQSII